LLASAGLLTHLDLDALAFYCQSYATWRTATATVEREGATFTTKTGAVKRHPAAALAQQAVRDLQTWADRLGLTPAARQRMRVELASAEQPPRIMARDRKAEAEEYMARRHDLDAAHGP
jgi:P27 family predicted phage terminase small subunit